MSRAGALDWLVFGEDWVGHPSTTQHLVRNLPTKDRVVWVDSIGMRTPRLNGEDLKRIVRKGAALLGAGPSSRPASSQPPQVTFAHLRPAVIPWHGNRVIRRINQRQLKRSVLAKMAEVAMASRPVLITSNPLLVDYLQAVPHGRVLYLRLDRYADLPGVERELVLDAEPRMFAAADTILATARELLPQDEILAAKSFYLPQGVDTDHFARVPETPPQSRVLGFCGLLAEWVDFELILTVAKKLPEWTLEFVGPVRYLPDEVKAQPNVRILPPVPYAELPEAMAHWAAAWVPFEVSELTAAVNPLKIREYLAAGLPSHCTPLPEVESLTAEADVLISLDSLAIVEWLKSTAAGDTVAKRRGRRAAMASHSWVARCKQLRGIAAGTAAGRLL